MERNLEELLQAFQSTSPVPAGGAAAALALANGAALGLKVIRLTLNRELDPETRERLLSAESTLSRVIEEGLPKFDEDCAAVRALLAQKDVARASEAMMDIPLAVLRLASEGIAAIRDVLGAVKPRLRCDAGAAANLMRSAAQISHWNLTHNASWRTEPSRFEGVLDEARELIESARASYDGVASCVEQWAVG